LLFVSGDESQAGFYKYWGEMGFGAIPFEEQAAREGLESRFNIEAYPALIMLGPKPADEFDNFGDRPIINTEVRAVIENGDYITDFPFYPKPWGDLCKTTDDINTHKCLIVFFEGGDENDQLDVEDAIQEAAVEYRGDEFIKFYWANDPVAGLASNIRQVCELGPIREEPTMVLLDIKDDGAYFVSKEKEITPETIKFFLLNYKESEQRGEI
jgi:nucleoredoxin